MQVVQPITHKCIHMYLIINTTIRRAIQCSRYGYITETICHALFIETQKRCFKVRSRSKVELIANNIRLFHYQLLYLRESRKKLTYIIPKTKLIERCYLYGPELETLPAFTHLVTTDFQGKTFFSAQPCNSRASFIFIR